MSAKVWIGIAVTLVVLFGLFVLIKPFGPKDPAAKAPIAGQYGGPTMADRQKAIEAEQQRGTSPNGVNGNGQTPVANAGGG